MKVSGALVVPIVAVGFLGLGALLYALSPVLLVHTYETDVYHTLDLLKRLQLGYVPHIETATPLGVLSILPIYWLAEAGLRPGLAMLWSQFAVALVCLPAIIHVALSRFSAGVGVLFSIFVLVLFLGLSQGDLTIRATFGMHYNRWCWAFALLAIPVAVLPGQKKVWVDGLLLGLVLSALALTKMTFFVAFFPILTVALILRSAFSEMVVAAIVGLIVVLAMTVQFSPEFWLAYYFDLASLLDSQFRQQPGDALALLVILPEFVFGSVFALIGYFALRNGSETRLAIAIIGITIGGIYATYQSYDNPPFWFAILGLVLLTASTEKAKLLGAGLILLGAPLFMNLSYTVLWHTALARAGGPEIFEGADLAIQSHPIRVSDYSTTYAPVRSPQVITFQDDDYIACEVYDGLRDWFVAVADDLTEAGIGSDAGLFFTEVIGSMWMAAVSRPPLANRADPYGASAPWYYDGLPGISAADFVVVPKCSIDLERREAILNKLEASELSFEKEFDGRMVGIYRIIQ